jgi:hypothetical protein
MTKRLCFHFAGLVIIPLHKFCFVGGYVACKWKWSLFLEVPNFHSLKNCWLALAFRQFFAEHVQSSALKSVVFGTQKIWHQRICSFCCRNRWFWIQKHRYNFVFSDGRFLIDVTLCLQDVDIVSPLISFIFFRKGDITPASASWWCTRPYSYHPYQTIWKTTQVQAIIIVVVLKIRKLRKRSSVLFWLVLVHSILNHLSSGFFALHFPSPSPTV